MKIVFQYILSFVFSSLILTACEHDATQNVISKVAFGSCAKQWLPQPIWNSIAQQDPDIFIFLGDAIYGDWNDTNVFEVTEQTLDRDYGKLSSIPEFNMFKASTPILATWDNHDYGSHNGGVDFPNKDLTKLLFLDFFGEPEGSERRISPGIYDAKIIGPVGKRIQFILLDTRWFKSPFKLDPLSSEERDSIGKVGMYIANIDEGVTLLGDTQWQWLEEQMKAPTEVRLICSGTQVIPNQKGMDEWGNYPRDRDRLLELISGSSGKTIILSGNAHFAEFSRIDRRGIEITEFTSSGLTHINNAYGTASNSFRVGQPFIDLNFGMIEIDWEKMLIQGKIMNEQGIVVDQLTF